MMNNNIAFNIARVLFVISVPLLCLSAGITIAINSQWFYEYGFRAYDVGQTTGLADSELHKAAGGLIDYFNNGYEYIDLTVIKDGQPFTLFNKKEILHLADVKSLIRLDYNILIGTGLYVLLFALSGIFWLKDEYRQRLARAALAGSILTTALMAVIGIMAVINFNQFFTWFHLISFANDFWLLDPSKDYLIMLFPGGFWSDAAIYVAAATLLFALLIGGIAGIYLWKRRRAQREDARLEG
jgi:integral membrane protein (TIGR01906 family)